MSSDKKEGSTDSIEELKRRLAEAELAEEVIEGEIVPDTEMTPHVKALPISDEERSDLPFLANDLLFVICGESERALNVARIVQIIPVDDDAQAVIIYDMEMEGNRFTTQIIQHRVADIRKALS